MQFCFELSRICVGFFFFYSQMIFVFIVLYCFTVFLMCYQVLLLDFFSAFLYSFCVHLKRFVPPALRSEKFNMIRKKQVTCNM